MVLGYVSSFTASYLVLYLGASLDPGYAVQVGDV